MPAPEKIRELVSRFNRNRDAYRSPSYKEAHVRQEFLNPFFKELGWDVYNEQGYAEAYKDIVHEATQQVEGAPKAPDYSFRIGGIKKFFCEAKKPSVNLKYGVHPAYQLRRYAWSANLPLSILTDFEELAVYDCRFKPEKNDKASTARVLYMTYDEYDARWEQIQEIFSKEAILLGSFDNYAKETKNKRGTADVDDEFLREIESWRELLAKNIALRNPELSVRELNFSVQRTIDRILFLRICEDRGMEDYGRLGNALETSGSIYEEVTTLFWQADQKYNSGLFHFQQERNRPGHADELTLRLRVDDEPLKHIIGNLYYPDSPYEFRVLPADILGHVYERFLGSTIRLTPKHRAKIEQKPEVRHAGGVYYTPAYIVDHIVKHTLTPLVSGYKPGPRGGVSKLRILDNACGSGSFLLGAYRFLLDWHLTEYSKDADKYSKYIYQGEHGDLRLTIDERKRILTENIYGVDLDPQAVEVTKLSLLLQVLEGETEETLEAQLKLFATERALPDLSANIKSGNSLIGIDFGEQQIDFLTEEEQLRVNPFDWNTEFAAVFDGADGGFDAIIGNPPYIRIQTLQEWAPHEAAYYTRHYQAAQKGNFDLYLVFVQRSLELLNPQGRLGYILPHKFFTLEYGEPLRDALSKGHHLEEIVHFGTEQVFESATTYTCLLFLNKNASNEFRFQQVEDLEAWRRTKEGVEATFSASDLTESEWHFQLGAGRDLLDKLKSMPHTLGDEAERVFQGLATSADSVYVLTLVEEGEQRSQVRSKELGGEVVEIENALLHPLLKGDDIPRYRTPTHEQVVLYPYRVNGDESAAIGHDELRDSYPGAYGYLRRNKQRLLERSKTDESNWWLFPYPKNLARYEQPKILVGVLGQQGRFAPDFAGRFYFVGGGTAGGNAILVPRQDPLEMKYLLGILNSRLTTYWVSNVASSFRGGAYAFAKSSLDPLPLPVPDAPEVVEGRAGLIALVGQMIANHHQLDAAKLPHHKENIERRITATDRQINELVYRLYSLSDGEIKIIEEAVCED